MRENEDRKEKEEKQRKCGQLNESPDANAAGVDYITLHYELFIAA